MGMGMGMEAQPGYGKYTPYGRCTVPVRTFHRMPSAANIEFLYNPIGSLQCRAERALVGAMSGALVPTVMSEPGMCLGSAHGLGPPIASKRETGEQLRKFWRVLDS